MQDNSFENFNLKMPILRGIFAHGFTEPSEIQAKTIPVIISGKDILAQSQSGTGKTGAFVISTLQIVSAISVVIAPTREIAIQIYGIYKEIGHFSGINFELCIGGTNLKTEIENKPTIIVATLGRLLEMISKKIINTDNINMLVIDEADELLSTNFEDQLYCLIKQLTTKCQIAMFSATLNKEVINLSKKIMKNPEIYQIKQQEVPLDGIKQYYIDCGERKYKTETLIELFEKKLTGQTIIFVNSIKIIADLKQKLEKECYVVSVIHSELSQNERNEIMRKFKEHSSNILIATDLIARGIDVYGVEMVVNYDVPNTKDSYIHRIGRTGRYGRKGVAVNLAAGLDLLKISEIESFYDVKMIKVISIDDISI